MKIGPFEIVRSRTFAQPTVKAPSSAELGGSGTQIFSGSVSGEEYNSTLDTSYGGTGLSIYERMRRSDPVVKQSLKMIFLPILKGEWTVEEAEDQKGSEEHKEFIEEALLSGDRLNRSFSDLLGEILTYLTFGFSVFEKVFKVEDRKVWLDKVDFRAQKSIRAFETEDHQKGITQYLVSDIDKGTKDVSIPIEKLLIFSNEKEGDNWRGVSLLRAAYKPWFFKEAFEKIDAISFERQGLGIPVFRMPKAPTPDDKAKADELGQNLRANEKAYVTLPYGWELEILDMKAKGSREGDTAIKRFNREILINVLAQFMDLGGGETGSWSLSKTQEQPFSDSVQSYADYIAEIFNAHAVHQLIDLNFEGIENYPKLAVGGIKKIALEELSTGLQRLTQSGLITPDKELEEFLRRTFNLPIFSGEPTVDDEDDKILPQDKKEEKKTEKEKDKKVDKIMKEKGKVKKFSDKVWRPLTFAEEKIDFEYMKRRLDELEATLAKNIQALMMPEIRQLLDDLRPAIAMRDAKRVEDIQIRYKEELRVALIDHMQKAFEFGKKTASDEMTVPMPKTEQERINLIVTKANAMADKVMGDLIAKAKFVALDHIGKQTPVEVAMRSLEDVLNMQMDRSVGLASSNIMMGGVNQGRNVVFEEYPNRIYALQRSEILDKRVCNYCLSMDGRVVEKTDQFVGHDQFHYYCRGIWVEILMDETEKPAIGGIPKQLRERVGTLDEFKQINRPVPLEGSLAEEFVKQSKI